MDGQALLRVDVAGVPVMVRGKIDYDHLTQVNRALAISRLALHKIMANPAFAVAIAEKAIQDMKGNV